MHMHQDKAHSFARLTFYDFARKILCFLFSRRGEKNGLSKFYRRKSYKGRRGPLYGIKIRAHT